MRFLTLLFLAFLVPAIALGQTQQDRVAATTYLNRSIPALSGTTPDVSLGNVFLTASNGTITSFSGGTTSQQIWVICGDALTNIASSGNIVTSGGTLSCSLNTVYSFIFNGTNWIQSGTGAGGGGGGGSTTPGLPNTSIQFNCSGGFCGDSGLEYTSSTDSLTATGNGSTTATAICGASGCAEGLQITESSHTTALSGATNNVSGTNTTLSGATSLKLKGSTASNSFLWPTGTPTAGLVPMTGTTSTGVTSSSWSNNFTQGLQATLGTLTTDINPFNLTFTLNNASQVFNGVLWNATNTSYGAGSFDYQFCADTIHCLTMDPLGEVQSANQIGSGDGSAGGNLEMLQGPLPAIIPNNVGWFAGTSVASGGFLIQMPSNPCSGPLNVAATGAYGMMSCGSTPGTFATLPACASGTEGNSFAVTDSSTNTWGATITGGSTNHVLAYCNGTAYTVAAK